MSVDPIAGYVGEAEVPAVVTYVSFFVVRCRGGVENGGLEESFTLTCPRRL